MRKLKTKFAPPVRAWDWSWGIGRFAIIANLITSLQDQIVNFAQIVAVKKTTEKRRKIMPEENKDIYKMELHDEIFPWDGLEIMKVHGGWIYRNYTEVVGGHLMGTSVFVPDTREPKKDQGPMEG